MVCKCLIKLIPKGTECDIEATVTKEDDAPIEGVTILIGNVQGTTGADGVALLSSFKKGTCAVFASHPDYESYGGVFVVD